MPARACLEGLLVLVDRWPGWRSRAAPAAGVRSRLAIASRSLRLVAGEIGALGRVVELDQRRAGLHRGAGLNMILSTRPADLRRHLDLAHRGQRCRSRRDSAASARLCAGSGRDRRRRRHLAREEVGDRLGRGTGRNRRGRRRPGPAAAPRSRTRSRPAAATASVLARSGRQAGVLIGGRSPSLPRSFGGQAAASVLGQPESRRVEVGRDRRSLEPDAAQDEAGQIAAASSSSGAGIGIGRAAAEPAERRHRRHMVGEPERVAPHRRCPGADRRPRPPPRSTRRTWAGSRPPPSRRPA